MAPSGESQQHWSPVRKENSRSPERTALPEDDHAASWKEELALQGPQSATPVGITGKSLVMGHATAKEAGTVFRAQMKHLLRPTTSLEEFKQGTYMGEEPEKYTYM